MLLFIYTLFVLSPNLIQRVYHFQYYTILKVIHAGVVLGLGLRLRIHCYLSLAILPSCHTLFI